MPGTPAVGSGAATEYLSLPANLCRSFYNPNINGRLKFIENTVADASPCVSELVSGCQFYSLKLGAEFLPRIHIQLHRSIRATKFCRNALAKRLRQIRIHAVAIGA